VPDVDDRVRDRVATGRGVPHPNAEPERRAVAALADVAAHAVDLEVERALCLLGRAGAARCVVEAGGEVAG
jgi:hypothetical protein